MCPCYLNIWTTTNFGETSTRNRLLQDALDYIARNRDLSLSGWERARLGRNVILVGEQRTV
jgi:hypothetical protein